MDRNQWPAYAGIGGRNGPEQVAGMTGIRTQLPMHGMRTTATCSKPVYPGSFMRVAFLSRLG